MNFTKNISKIYLSVSDVSYIYILNYFYHPAFVQNRYCSKADCSKADFQLEHVLVPRLFPYTSVNRTTCFKLLIDYSEQCIVLSSRWTMLCYIHKVLYLEKLSLTKQIRLRLAYDYGYKFTRRKKLSWFLSVSLSLHTGMDRDYYYHWQRRNQLICAEWSDAVKLGYHRWMCLWL